MNDEFDVESLAKSDGKEGRPAYIVYNGRIVDVSKSKLWSNGIHMGRHQAGTDLTADIEAAPHGPEMLDRYSQVGVLVKGTVSGSGLPPLLSALLVRYPFFRRHPHPASVHFPIVFTFSASFFSVLYALTGNSSFDQTAFYCLAGALLFTPLAIVTGLFTWWVNYMARPLRPVTIKKYLSLTAFVVMICLFAWRVVAPGMPAPLSTAPAILYFVLIVALSPAVFVVSYYGGTLTFPLSKE